MIVYSGQDVIVDGVVVHVQDVDFINLSAKVGVPDENDLIWNTNWVPFSSITSVVVENNTHLSKKL